MKHRHTMHLALVAFTTALTSFVGTAQGAPVSTNETGAVNAPFIVKEDASSSPHTGGVPYNLNDVPVTRTDRAAIARVAFAEAANQGDDGIAGVIFVILNRIASHHFGQDVQSVINAPGQFEPVMRAGGNWTFLPPLTAEQQVRFNTVFNLIFDGLMPDPTNGALYFQNAAIVAARETAGLVSPGLTNFGGQAPIARIHDHSFYWNDLAGVGGLLPPTPPGAPILTPEMAGLFSSVSAINADSKATAPKNLTPESQQLFVPVEMPEASAQRHEKSSDTDLHKAEPEKDQGKGKATEATKNNKHPDAEAKEVAAAKVDGSELAQEQNLDQHTTSQGMFIPVRSNQ